MASAQLTGLLERLRSPNGHQRDAALESAFAEMLTIRPEGAFRLPQDRLEVIDRLAGCLDTACAQVPPELVSWFSAHDGQIGIAHWSPGVEGRLLSLDEAWESRRRVLATEEPGPTLVGRRTWLPLISIGPSVLRTSCWIFDLTPSGNGLVVRRHEHPEKYAMGRRAPVSLRAAVESATTAWGVHANTVFRHLGRIVSRRPEAFDAPQPANVLRARLAVIEPIAFREVLQSWFKLHDGQPRAQRWVPDDSLRALSLEEALVLRDRITETNQASSDVPLLADDAGRCLVFNGTRLASWSVTDGLETPTLPQTLVPYLRSTLSALGFDPDEEEVRKLPTAPKPNRKERPPPKPRAPRKSTSQPASSITRNIVGTWTVRTTAAELEAGLRLAAAGETWSLRLNFIVFKFATGTESQLHATGTELNATLEPARLEGFLTAMAAGATRFEDEALSGLVLEAIPPAG